MRKYIHRPSQLPYSQHLFFQPLSDLNKAKNDGGDSIGTSTRTGNLPHFQNGQAKGQSEEEGIETASSSAPSPLLNAAQIREITIFMRNTYSLESLALLRSHFGLSAGSQIDRVLLMAIAQYQNSKGGSLVVDGMLGENSFNALQAETGEATRDLVIFTLASPSSGGMRKASSGGLTDMLDHFTVEIHLPPDQDCSQYVYRQSICARVEMLLAASRADGAMIDFRSLFLVKGGAFKQYQTLQKAEQRHWDLDTGIVICPLNPKTTASTQMETKTGPMAASLGVGTFQASETGLPIPASYTNLAFDS